MDGVGLHATLSECRDREGPAIWTDTIPLCGSEIMGVVLHGSCVGRSAMNYGADKYSIPGRPSCDSSLRRWYAPWHSLGVS